VNNKHCHHVVFEGRSVTSLWYTKEAVNFSVNKGMRTFRPQRKLSDQTKCLKQVMMKQANINLC